MSTVLARREGGTLADAGREWRRMTEAEQRRAASAAANTYDAPELWRMVQAHMSTNAAQGTGTSPHTIRAYEAGVRQVVTHCRDEGENLLRPSREAGPAYREALRTAGYAPATINQRLSAARALWAALRHYGATTADPFDGVKGARDPRAMWDRRTEYPLGVVRALLEVLEREELTAQAAGDATEAAKARSDRRMVLLGADAGLRAAEMVALTWGDVDQAARTLRVLGKGSKERHVPCSPALWAALEADRGADDEPVLLVRSASGARYRLDRALQLAGVLDSRPAGSPRGSRSDYGLHRLRHTAGTRLTRLHGIHVAQVILGHASPATTARYAHADPEALAAAVAAASVA